MINSLFLDFDGVILESVSAKTDAFYTMYLPYGVDFAQRVRDFHEANGGVSRFEKFKIWNGQWLQEELNDERLNALSETFSQLSLKKVTESPFVPGAREFLEWAHSRFNLFIITGSAQDDIDATIHQLQIGGYFKQICGSPRAKTDWGRELLAHYKINADQTIFVGDAESDFKAATALGTHFILRTTELNQHWSGKCSVTIPDLHQLPQKIEEISRKLTI
jgi:HAD superfamily hydrolase (TIGR01549 family)